MPLKVNAAPPDMTSLARRLAALESQITELRAAKTLQSAAIGKGGLTVQAPGDAASMRLAAEGDVNVLAYGVGVTQPPALEFASGNGAEVTPGAVLAYEADGGGYAIPTILALTPDLGNGTASLKIQAGVPGHTTAAAQIATGGASVALTQTGLFLTLPDGTSIALGAWGATFLSSAPVALTMSNGWTATGGLWQLPFSIRQIDNTIMLLGSLTPGTLTAGTVIMTLPTGTWPPGDLEFRVPGGSATAYCDLVVHRADGTVTITNVAGTITRISLSSIRYSL